MVGAASIPSSLLRVLFLVRSVRRKLLVKPDGGGAGAGAGVGAGVGDVAGAGVSGGAKGGVDGACGWTWLEGCGSWLLLGKLSL